MDGGAWWAAVHGVAKSRTWLRDFTFTFHFHALEKEMATHSSVLAWRIPGMGEPGGLPSMGSHRVRQDWSDLAAAAAARIFMIFLCMGMCKSLGSLKFFPRCISKCLRSLLVRSTEHSAIVFVPSLCVLLNLTAGSYNFNPCRPGCWTRFFLLTAGWY